MFKKVIEYLGRAVRSNTGISSLSLIAVAVGIASVVTLVVICVCMMVEIITTHTISSSLEGYAAIITAVSTLIASIGIPKAINNYGENKYGSQHKEEENTDIQLS